jgi:methionine-rich copper-binding protein CopC
MKAKNILIGMTLGVMPMLYSCSLGERDVELNPAQYGSASFELDAEAEFENSTRALSESDYKNSANYDVKLVNTSNENVLLECKYSEINDNLPKKLEVGSYRVEATYGKEHAFSRDEFLMSGSTVFSIKANQEETVNVDCAPTCGKLSVAFDETMATYFSDYSVTYSGTEAMGSSTCTWAKDDTEPWYVALKEGGETINYTISVTTKDDYLSSNNGVTSKESKITGTISLNRNKAHKLTIKPNYTPTTDGGMTLVITIDDSTNDKNIEWQVPVTWI